MMMERAKVVVEYILADDSRKKMARRMWYMTSTWLRIRGGSTVTWNMTKTLFCSEERELSRFRYVRPVMSATMRWFTRRVTS